MQDFVQIAESALAQIHENIVIKMAMQKLLTEGYIDLENLNVINKLAHRIISESSDLFIPDVQELQESLAAALQESEGKILVDPETGDQYIYDPTTGELLPADNSEVMDDEDSVPAEDDVSDEVEDVPAEDEDIPAEDVSASEIKTESTEIKTESTAQAEQTILNENEELILNLIKKIKEV